MDFFVKTIIALLLAMPTAQAMDGNDLLSGYNSYKKVKAGNASGTDAYQAGLFDGYVAGIYDSTVGMVLCVKGGVSSGQIQEVVGQFLESHPESRQRSAVMLATQALMKTFPCK